MIFNTITVSDGISMGSEGMRYSLVSREVIADSIETVAGAEGFDGLVTIGGCDKNMPACAMAMARLDRPSVFVYGGTIMPGNWRGKPVDIVSVFEAVGQHAAGKITDADLADLEQHACPGAGSCGGMYTANTMASAIEALGLSLPNSSAQAAISREKLDDCQRAGAAVARLVAEGITPRRILTRQAFENAITVVVALGGSTNAVLHLLAIASAAGVKLTLDDFTRVGKRVPVLADLRPSGTYVMAELVRIGGLTPLMKRLLDHGLLHGDALTVTGRTLAENLAGTRRLPAGAGRGPRLRRAGEAREPSGRAARQPGARRRRGQDQRQGGRAVHRPGDRLRPRRARPRGDPRAAGSRPGTSSSSATRGRRAGRACARCCRRPARSSAAGSATPWPSSPTDGSRAARTGSWSATSPRRRRSAARWRWSAAATSSPSTRRPAPSTSTSRRANWRRGGGRGAAVRPAATRGVLAKYARLVGSASDGAVTDVPRPAAPARGAR